MTFYEQRAEKFKKERQVEHAEYLRQQEIAEQTAKAENAAARARYLAKLDGDRKAKQAEHDAEIELQLAPEKRRLQNEWLANNPNETAADFEKNWHLLKENLIEQHNAEAFEAEKQRQMESGRYSL